MNTALVIIDVQNDYCNNGKMELEGMDEALGNCKDLLEKCRAVNIPVFHVQHISLHEGAFFFLPDTEGCKIHNHVEPNENETIIIKNYPNSFFKTELQEKLKEVEATELIICGAMSHMCIDTTVRAAVDLGYSCKVIHDACATRSLEFEGRIVTAKDVHSAFMAALKFAFAKLYNTKDFIRKELM
jgi:nicotinamidase-related amidase